MDSETLNLIIGIAGILIGIIASYIFYRVSLRQKEPCWYVKSNNLVQGFSSKLERVQVLYDAEKVENLTISKILFWNAGKETINKDDITDADPIKVVALNNAKVLDIKILSFNNGANRFTGKKGEDENSAYLFFEYLDNQQGAVIQVVHTGTSSNDVAVTGMVKGAKNIRRRRPSALYLPLPTPIGFDKRIKYKLRRKIFLPLALIEAILFMIFISWTAFALPPYGSLFDKIMFGFFASLTLILLVIALLSLRNAIPEGLESYDED